MRSLIRQPAQEDENLSRGLRLRFRGSSSRVYVRGEGSAVAAGWRLPGETMSEKNDRLRRSGSATQAGDRVSTLNKDFVVKLTGLATVTVDTEGKSHAETPQKIVGVPAAWARFMAETGTHNKSAGAVGPFARRVFKTSRPEKDEKKREGTSRRAGRRQPTFPARVRMAGPNIHCGDPEGAPGSGITPPIVSRPGHRRPAAGSRDMRGTDHAPFSRPLQPADPAGRRPRAVRDSSAAGLVPQVHLAAPTALRIRGQLMARP
jgi:hypothetical protein